MNTIVSIAVVVVALIALFYFVNRNNQQTQKKIEMMDFIENE